MLFTLDRGPSIASWSIGFRVHLQSGGKDGIYLVYKTVSIRVTHAFGVVESVKQLCGWEQLILK